MGFISYYVLVCSVPIWRNAFGYVQQAKMSQFSVQYTINLTSFQQNVPIDAPKFAKPSPPR